MNNQEQYAAKYWAKGHGFGNALAELRSGGRVARKGWNGKGMWLVLVLNWYPETIECEAAARDLFGANNMPFIGMKTAGGEFVPWLASQTDILAEDWVVVQ